MSEREPITAELRAAMNVDREYTMGGDVVARMYCMGRDEFADLCDAIDAVHAALERENAELRQRLAVLDNERGNMHDGWIRLPLDADGVPIHVGDVIVTTEWHEEVVEGILPERVLVLRDGEWFTIRADWCRHHAPTVEDVLREMHAELDEVTALYVGEAIDSDERDRDEARIFAEYAAKLRLVGDAE